MGATDLREQALAKFLEAKALVGEDGAISAENEPHFQTIMAEAMRLDKEYAAAKAKEDGGVEKLSERLAWYTGKATGEAMRFNSTELDPKRSMSLGAQFTSSEEYKRLVASGALETDNRRFDTGRIVLTPRPVMGAAASDVIQTESGGPANSLVLPWYMPGIMPLAQRPLTVRQLFAQGRMTQGDSLSYAKQSGFDNAAAAVAQATAVNGSGASGGVKPQSSIAWTRDTAVAEWIATWMVVTRQALADAGVIASIIDNQGRLMLQLEEEDQLLNGNGTSPNLSGLYDQTIQTLDLTGEDNLDGIRTARRLVKTGVSRLDAEWIVVNPEDSEEFDLLKDLNDNYRGGNPIGNFNFDQSIWRLRRVESEAIDAGSALVGSSAGATVLERQPITVLTADQHADFFIRNLVVVLFEERLAFPVWFPSAFVDITLADWAS